MKIICSTVLVVFFSSFVCYGFEDSWIYEDSSVTSDSLKEDVKKMTDSPTYSSLEEGTSNYEKDEKGEENEGSWVKDAGLGVGKAALGLMCAYIAFSTSFQRYIFTSLDDGPEEKQNMILNDLGACVECLEKRDIIGLVFEDIDQSFKINTSLTDLFGHLCCLTMSGYGAYKVGISACNSFAEAYKKITNTATETFIDTSIEHESDEQGLGDNS